MAIIKGQTPLRFQQVAEINFPVVEVPVQGEEAQSFLKALRGYQRVHSYLPALDVREALLISVLPGAFVPRSCAAKAVCHVSGRYRKRSALPKEVMGVPITGKPPP